MTRVISTLTIAAELRNRREMVNHGHGNVTDESDELCERAANRLDALEATLVQIGILNASGATMTLRLIEQSVRSPMVDTASPSLVERLRDLANIFERMGWGKEPVSCREAADEIERLRAAIRWAADAAYEGFLGDDGGDSALCDINNSLRDTLDGKNRSGIGEAP